MPVRPQRESAHTHPGFACAYAGLVSLGERLPLGRWRTALLASARGRLLVVGLGPGCDLDHLPPEVTSVVAVEPDPAMRRAAARRIARARDRGVPVSLVSAVGERLPLGAASMDTALCALVLCSVDDVGSVLREIRRVLRPDGTLLVLEHVRARTEKWAGRVGGRLQDTSAPAWRRVAGGCNPHRRTRESLAAAGFDTSGVADVTLWTGVPLLAPHLRGVARSG